MGDALGALFKWASRHRRDAIHVNPIAGVWRPAPPSQRQRVLNARGEIRQADELRQFWKATGITGQPFGPLFRLLLLLGFRSILSINLVQFHPIRSMVVEGERLFPAHIHDPVAQVDGMSEQDPILESTLEPRPTSTERSKFTPEVEQGSILKG